MIAKAKSTRKATKATSSDRIGLNGNGHSNGSNGNGKPAAPKRPCNAEIELMVQRLETLQREAKAAYQAADQIENELIAILSGGATPLEALAKFGRGETDSIKLSDNRTLRLTSKFFYASGEAKTKAFGMAGVQPVEVEVK